MTTILVRSGIVVRNFVDSSSVDVHCPILAFLNGSTDSSRKLSRVCIFHGRTVHVAIYRVTFAAFRI